MRYQPELDAALAAAAAASEYIRGEYEKFTPIPNAPVTISTHVDHTSQAMILRALAAAFPGDALCAEETGGTAAGTSGRTWVVDPIDGTRGFATKNGQFSVMIGLTENGVPVVGVVAEPVLDRVTYATLGGGCWVTVNGGEPTRCGVSAVAALADVTLTQSLTKPGRPPTPGVRAVKPKRVIETYSAGVKLALVARGEADVYVNDYAEFHDWDICAGHVLVTEAGGTVTAFDGSAIGYGAAGFKQRGGLLASNGPVHAAVIAAVKAHG